MKKMLLFIAILLIGGLTTKAQESRYGIRIGANISSISSDDIIDDLDQGRISPVVGFFGDFVLTEKLSIQPELQYSGQGNKDKNLRSDYLQLPVLLKYNFNNMVNLQLGPQAGLKIWEWEDKIEGNTDFSTFDYAIVAGIGVNITDNFFADVRYSFGLANVFDDSDLPISVEGNNRVIQIAVGYRL